MSKRISNEIFIKRCVEKYGDKYDYSLVAYKNMKSKVKIKCRNNHVFEQTPESHLNGRGCVYCINRGDMVFNLKSFIDHSNKLHDHKYDYSKSNYINGQTKLDIICQKHGVFKQTPNCHLTGSGCRKCYHDSLKSNINDIILRFKKIHGDKYNYDGVIYNKSSQKVNIFCKKHGYFLQSPSVHLSGKGCRECMKERFRLPYSEFINRCNSVWGDRYEYIQNSYFDQRRKMKVICHQHGVFEVSPDSHISKKKRMS